MPIATKSILKFPQIAGTVPATKPIAKRCTTPEPRSSDRSVAILVMEPGAYSVEFWTPEEWEAIPEASRPDQPSFSEALGMWWATRTLHVMLSHRKPETSTNSAPFPTVAWEGYQTTKMRYVEGGFFRFRYGWDLAAWNRTPVALRPGNFDVGMKRGEWHAQFVLKGRRPRPDDRYLLCEGEDWSTVQNGITKRI